MQSGLRTFSSWETVNVLLHGLCNYGGCTARAGRGAAARWLRGLRRLSGRARLIVGTGHPEAVLTNIVWFFGHWFSLWLQLGFELVHLLV